MRYSVLAAALRGLFPRVLHHWPALGVIFVPVLLAGLAAPAMSAPAPEIAIMGNSLVITNGDTTPSATDHTDFGNALVTGGTVARTFTITNAGSAALNVAAINVTGPHAADFTVTGITPPATVAVGASKNFTVTFDPGATGTRNATITVGHDAGHDPDYDFAVRGTGAPPGAALDFDGVNDLVTLPPTLLTNSYTKEAWVYRKISGTSGKNIISSFNGHVFWVSPAGNLAAGHNGTYAHVLDPAVFPSNTWTHVAVAYAAADGALTLYKNGLLVASTNGVPAYDVGPALAIGAHGTNAGSRFFGPMDELRLWNRALCDNEIAGRMNCELAGTESGLVAYYRCNQGIAGGLNTGVTALEDASTNDFDGALVNFALNGATSNWIEPGGVVTGTSCGSLPPSAFAPVMVCPTNIVAGTCGGCEAVNYPPPAVLNGALAECQPPSGTCFPLGTNGVTCVATNACATNICSFTVTVRSTNCVKAPPGMVLWLPFDEPSGTIAHNLVEGAPDGVLAFGTTHVLGEHVLNSLHGGALVPNYSAIVLDNQHFTIDTWVRRLLPHAAFPELFVVKAADFPGPGLGLDEGYAFYMDSGGLHLRLEGPGAEEIYDAGADVPLDNQWHHLAVTVRRGAAGEVRFYLDGTNVASLPGPVPANIGTEDMMVVNYYARSDLDELEIFRRVLSPAEIYRLWAAGSAGKCKFKCAIPGNRSFPPGTNCVTVQARVCNCTPMPQTIDWTATGPIPIPTASGSVFLPPFTCVFVPVTLCPPSNAIPAGEVVQWTMTLQPSNHCPIKCMGSLVNPGLIAVSAPFDTVQVPGTNRPVVIHFQFAGLPPGHRLQFLAVGPDMQPDRSAISLDGRPPGTPLIVTPGGGAGSIPVSIRFAEADPTGSYTLLVQADLNGDQNLDAVTSVDLENPVVPPVTLRARHVPQGVELDWADEGEGLGALEAADDLLGPWAEVPNARPGVVVAPVQRGQFFRVAVPWPE